MTDTDGNITVTSPSPEEIRAQRASVDWSIAGAAASVCVTERAWRNWEAGTRKMPPGTWLLFTLLIGRRTIAYEAPKGRAVLRLAIEETK